MVTKSHRTGWITIVTLAVVLCWSQVAGAQSFVVLQHIACNETTSGSGDDDLLMKVFVDGKSKPSIKWGGDENEIGSGQIRHLGWRVEFRKEVKVEVWEWDTGGLLGSGDDLIGRHTFTSQKRFSGSKDFPFSGDGSRYVLRASRKRPRMATLTHITCFKPATGVDAGVWKEVTGLVAKMTKAGDKALAKIPNPKAQVGAAVLNAMGEVLNGSHSVAKAIDEARNDPDQLYLCLGNVRDVDAADWPRGSYRIMNAGQTEQPNLEIYGYPNQEINVSLWEHDTGSRDDLLGVFNISFDKIGVNRSEPVISKAEQSIYGAAWFVEETSSSSGITTPEQTEREATVRTLTKSPQTFEAEKVSGRAGPIVATEHRDFHGAGYVDFQKASGEWVNWLIRTKTDGEYRLSFRYALASGKRPLRLKVNGKVIKEGLPFIETRSWDYWRQVVIRLPLRAGENDIRLESTGKSGPNIDNLTIARIPQATIDSERESGFAMAAGAAAFNTTPRALTKSPQTFEAEKVAGLSRGRVRSVGAVRASEHSGFQGDGYVDFQTPIGETVVWRIETKTAGEYSLSFRYALAGKNRPLRLTVNGKVIKNLPFSKTGGWDSWKTLSATAPLKAGDNDIRLMSTGASGPNIDNLTIKHTEQ